MCPALPPAGPPDGLRQRLSDNELMRGDGEVVADPEYDVTPVLRNSVAGVLHPSDSSWAYVFCGHEYVTTEVMGNTIVRGPKFIVDDWPSLSKIMFAGWIDAVLPIPNNTKQMYFFSGEDYALINADPRTPNDVVIDGPKNIITEWPSLRNAGFKAIDAVLLNPMNSEQAYFFRGEQYALIHILKGPNKDYIVDGPKPMWPCLKDAGFEEIVMILPNLSNANEAFVFSRSEYALISIGRDASDNHVVEGPKAIHIGWPSLRQVNFF